MLISHQHFHSSSSENTSSFIFISFSSFHSSIDIFFLRLNFIINAEEDFHSSSSRRRSILHIGFLLSEPSSSRRGHREEG